MSRCRRVAVLTHRRPQETAHVLGLLVGAARECGVVLRFDPDETAKHGLTPGDGVQVDVEGDGDVDLCVVLGGDGSILTALRRFAGTGIPVFGVNFGELGFLATIDPTEVADGFRRAFSGDFETLELPALTLADPFGTHGAINDVSLNRRPGARVATLAYRVGEQEVGRVRCDGLVVATPAGSTGYNLANGGPVLAWGVEGFVVSFVAPHSLTARALVVAPDDRLEICNASREDPVDLAVDGRPIGAVEPGATIAVGFVADRGTLAQLPGSSFYSRLRAKFGRLSS